jgi:hypothetical protein
MTPSNVYSEHPTPVSTGDLPNPRGLTYREFDTSRSKKTRTSNYLDIRPLGGFEFQFPTDLSSSLPNGSGGFAINQQRLTLIKLNQDMVA